jgi:hypothetical protein
MPLSDLWIRSLANRREAPRCTRRVSVGMRAALAQSTQRNHYLSGCQVHTKIAVC